MYLKDGKTFLENNDLCINCKKWKHRYSCPLLSAFHAGLIVQTEEFNIENCGEFEEYKRHLEIVKE